MTVLSDLAGFVCGPALQALPDDQRRKLRHHISDTAIALIAGASSPDGQALSVAQQPALASESIVNAAAIIRSTEVDDIHLQSCTTPSSIAVPVALMLSPDCQPQTIESAVYAGVETMVRLGLAINGPAILYRGIWPTCFAAPLAVAATASRIWQLDADRTCHALSLALMMAAGRTGRFAGTPSGRWIILKGAVMNGLLAASAARDGCKGDPSLLDQNWLETAHGITADTGLMINRMDTSCALAGLSMKPFSTARQALAATQALIELLDEGLDPQTIDAIKVRVPKAYQRMISQPINPAVRGTGYVSAAHQMALAALSRHSLWDLDRSAVMQNVTVQQFAARITVEASAGLQSRYPQFWPADIEVRTKDAATIKRVVETVRGDASLPLDDDARKQKAFNLLEPQAGHQHAAHVWDIAESAFDNAEAMRRLKDICTAAINANNIQPAA